MVSSIRAAGGLLRERGQDSRAYKHIIEKLFAGSGKSFAVRFWDGDILHVGDESAADVTFVLHTPAVLRSLDEDSVAEAYFRGDFDIEGDAFKAFDLRHCLHQELDLRDRLALLTRILFVPKTRNNVEAIDHHYSLGDDFYLSFLDTRYRIYSHGHFHSPDESLEDAQEHKLECMYQALALEPGMRLLDIGGGWGAVPQYAGSRGVQVTSLTLAPDSKRFIDNLIRENDLPCRVELKDFLEYRPTEPFDAIVIYGVIEHIPQYRAFVDQVWRCLKPGGLMYLDASATRVKYKMSSILKKTVWSATTAYLCTHDLLAELNYGGLELVAMHEETEDYRITMRHWAERFETSRDFIVSRWGERTYRIFQTYLWGGHICFERGDLQAYRMIIRRPMVRKSGPSWIRRAAAAVYGAR